jgi:hypothetical protein
MKKDIIILPYKPVQMARGEMRFATAAWRCADVLVFSYL